MAANQRPLSPHLQVYRPQITSVLSIFHRITGVILAFGAVMLVLWLVALANGPEGYTLLVEVLASPIGLLVLAGWTYAMFYHLCNGIRHLFWDAGVGFELSQAKTSGWIVVAASITLTVLVWAGALLGGGA
ncbi:MAG: succinate dehydrogenase, cytochrome b556 subunit [Pseudomonadota bacterium]